MMFRNDRQRKAMFANLNKFAADPKIIKIDTPRGTMLVKEDFAKEMATATVQRLPKKKSIVDIIKEEGGTPQTFNEMSAKSLEDAKDEYALIWLSGDSTENNYEAALEFLRKRVKSKDRDVRDWANKELLKSIRTGGIGEKESSRKDPTEGINPDYLKSDEDQKWLLD